MFTQLIEEIEKAMVREILAPTPLQKMPLLSSHLKQNIWAKREDLTPVSSFKIRGAYNKIVQLSKEEKKRGIITASAGNHAQGVAFSAQKLNIEATIFMPATTPSIKFEAVRRRGVTVVLVGDSYDDAFEAAQKEVEKTKAIYIHSFDDIKVMAGPL